MKENNILQTKYEETFLKILISEINIIKAYWNISEEYNNQFIKKYGQEFFNKTKQVIRFKNLTTETEQDINIENGQNSCYIKINYANSEYQAELLRIGIDDNKDYGYKIISNKIKSQNIKVLIDKYNSDKIKFKNLLNGNESISTNFYNPQNYKKENIKLLYEELILPSWNEYKIENSYKEK